MNKYEISPLTVKSGESLRYSESECTKDERNNVNVSRRSSVEYDGGSQQFSNTVVNNYKSLNADLTEQCDYQPPENIEETKIAEGDGTFKFILTEVVSGKTKVDLCYQSHASEWWYSQHSNSSMNYSNDNGMGSVEHSVENSDFIRNLMHRRNLSPPSGEKNSRDDPQIFVGSLSDASNESNIQITDPCSEDPFGENHPIRVESNKDSEDWDDASERLRYPLLHEIPEQHPEVETDGQSSFLKRGLEESKYSNEFSNGSQDLWDENYNPHEDNPVISAEGLPSNNNQNYLHPGHFSPETRSQQTLSNSSNCCLSPPASTFGINTTQSLDQQPIRPEESSENMNKGTSTVSKKSKFAKLAKSDMSLSKFSPVSGKKEEIHSTKSASPPKDITNLQHSNCRCTGCSNEQHTKFMLQNLMQTTDHKDGDNNYKENESSPQKLSSPVSSTENKISTEEKVYPQVYDNSTQDYFNKKESPEKDGQNNEENHKNVSQEYGLHNSSSECENIEPFYNDSKEDIFTHKDNNSMERQQIECDNDTQFSPISKIDDSHEDSSSLDKVPVKETDLVQPARSTKPKEIKNVKKKMITVKTNENLDINIPRNITKRNKSKKKKKLSTISPFEAHSSKMNSEYLRSYTSQKNNYITQDNLLKMKALNIKLENQQFVTKKKRSSIKSKKSSKRSPVQYKGYKKMLPKLYKRCRSKSPNFLNIELFNNLLKSNRMMLDKLKKGRRKSIEAVPQTKKLRARKKSPIKSPVNINLKKRLKARSPKIIVPPAINCKQNVLGRDKSMVILLQLNIN